MPRMRSGPPVAESSSAAVNSAVRARSMVGSRSQVLAPAELQHGAGVQAAGARGGDLVLLVAAAGDVVLEEPAHAAADVEAGEQGHHREALHGRRQVVAHHLPELVGLALEAERRALDLLVVLELELEQLDHLDGRARRAGDGDAGVLVGREHLLDRPVADEVARRGPAVAREHHTVEVADRHHGGAVGDAQLGTDGLGQRGAGHRRPAEELGEVGAGVLARSEEGHAHGRAGYRLFPPVPDPEAHGVNCPGGGAPLPCPR